MVNTLNELQRQLKAETDPVEREQIQMSIDALTEALKRNVREHNEHVERSESDD